MRMLRLFPCLLAAGLLLLPCERSVADIIFNDFSTTAGLTLNGSAQTATTNDGTVLRLTPAQQETAGSVFSTAKVSTSAFASIFSFRISGSGNDGADGIVFVAQNVANNVGGFGLGIGYGGLSPSVGVEFDTYFNAGNLDPSANHVAIDLNGNVVHSSTNGPVFNIPSPELDTGGLWWAWVTYDASSLKVYLTEDESSVEPARPALPILQYELDLASLLGAETAFVGFTSATGAAFSNHDLLHWRYTNAVPEPSSLVLAAVGAATIGIAFMSRRRKVATS